MIQMVWVESCTHLACSLIYYNHDHTLYGWIYFTICGRTLRLALAIVDTVAWDEGPVTGHMSSAHVLGLVGSLIRLGPKLKAGTKWAHIGRAYLAPMAIDLLLLDKDIHPSNKPKNYDKIVQHKCFPTIPACSMQLASLKSSFNSMKCLSPAQTKTFAPENATPSAKTIGLFSFTKCLA